METNPTTYISHILGIDATISCMFIADQSTALNSEESIALTHSLSFTSVRSNLHLSNPSTSHLNRIFDKIWHGFSTIRSRSTEEVVPPVLSSLELAVLPYIGFVCRNFSELVNPTSWPQNFYHALSWSLVYHLS